MQGRLVAMLLLASWAQQREDQRPLPMAAREFRVVRVMVGDHRIGENRQIREITLEIPAPPAAADEDDEPPLPQPVRPLNINTAVVERGNFDRWLFGEELGRGPERHLEEILLTRVRTAAREHDLSDAQRMKLQLAGRGDIKRFFDQVEDRRLEFEKARKSFRTGLAALQRLDDLSLIFRMGPFDHGSLFAKTLQKIRDDQKAIR